MSNQIKRTVAMLILAAVCVYGLYTQYEKTAQPAIGAQAGTLKVSAGTGVECDPFPTFEAIKNATVFQGDKPALTQVLTCKVSAGQTIPAQSTFVGELVAGSALGPYSFVWQRLILPGTGGSIVLDMADGELLSSRADNNGQLRLTFKRDLVISPATATTN